MVGSVKAPLRYAIPPLDGSHAFQPDQFSNLYGGAAPRRNFEYKFYEHKITNLRGRESTVSLDNNGMCFIQAGTRCQAFNELNAKDIEKAYYPECVGIIRKVVGRRAKVVIFEHSERSDSQLTQ